MAEFHERSCRVLATATGELAGKEVLVRVRLVLAVLRVGFFRALDVRKLVVGSGHVHVDVAQRCRASP